MIMRGRSEALASLIGPPPGARKRPARRSTVLDVARLQTSRDQGHDLGIAPDGGMGAGRLETDAERLLRAAALPGDDAVIATVDRRGGHGERPYQPLGLEIVAVEGRAEMEERLEMAGRRQTEWADDGRHMGNLVRAIMGEIAGEQPAKAEPDHADRPAFEFEAGTQAPAQ